MTLPSKHVYLRKLHLPASMWLLGTYTAPTSLLYALRMDIVVTGKSALTLYRQMRAGKLRLSTRAIPMASVSWEKLDGRQVGQIDIPALELSGLFTIDRPLDLRVRNTRDRVRLGTVVCHSTTRPLPGGSIVELVAPRRSQELLPSALDCRVLMDSIPLVILDMAGQLRVYVNEGKMSNDIAVMKLAEEKKLDINGSIDKYFPACSYAKGITVKQLLNMTSGIPDYIYSTRIDYREVKKPVPALSGALGSDYHSNKAAVLGWILSQKVTPSEKPVFTYSESNYYLLGEIIAKASGMRYEDYIQAAVFKLASMTKSGFGSVDSVAGAYTSQGASELLYDGVGYAAFGLITNVSDLLKLIDSLLSYQIITENSFKEIITDNGSGFGYGVYVSGNSLSCIGQTDAYSAKLSFSDDKSQIFVALSNHSVSDPNWLHRLFQNYLEKFSV